MVPVGVNINFAFRAAELAKWIKFVVSSFRDQSCQWIGQVVNLKLLKKLKIGFNNYEATSTYLYLHRRDPHTHYYNVMGNHNLMPIQNFVSVLLTIEEFPW